MKGLSTVQGTEYILPKGYTSLLRALPFCQPPILSVGEEALLPRGCAPSQPALRLRRDVPCPTQSATD